MFNEITTTFQKKTLQKVRSQFIRKKHDSDEDAYVDPATKYLNESTTFTLNSSLGLVETKRKICAGPHYINPFYTISEFILDETRQNKLVILNFIPEQEAISVPWEYVAKRLESYGDLELATWAHRIDNFYHLLSQVVSQPEHVYRKGDVVIRNSWDDVRARAIKARQKIEEHQSFHRVVFHFTKNSSHMMSNSFSEGFLEGMGYTPETFIKWVGENGMPITFNDDCAIFKIATKLYLEFTLFLGDPIYETTEYDVYLYNADGSKRKIVVQAFYILEPVVDGFLSYYYFVVKNVDTASFMCKSTALDANTNIELPSKLAWIDWH